MIIEVFFMMARFTLTLVRYVTAEKVTITAIMAIKDGGLKTKWDLSKNTTVAERALLPSLMKLGRFVK